VDLFPTLLELCSLPAPEGLSGQSLLPQLADPAAAASVKPALAFWSGGRRTVRTDRWRLIVHPRKGAEALFDYPDPHESQNVFDHPQQVAQLMDPPDPSRPAAKR
jgi:arylsulfatase A-like enzyme